MLPPTPFSPPPRLHSCSDYHVMEVCANCGLLISTVNVPQAAAGAWEDGCAPQGGAVALSDVAY